MNILCKEKPKILFENFITGYNNLKCDELHFYCFNGVPKFSIRLYGNSINNTTFYDEYLNVIDDVLSYGDKNLNIPADKLVIQAYEFSKKLSQDFYFVRVDWIIGFQSGDNKLFFEELTFTPYSGFYRGLNRKFNIKFGEILI